MRGDANEAGLFFIKSHMDDSEEQLIYVALFYLDCRWRSINNGLSIDLQNVERPTLEGSSDKHVNKEYYWEG